MDLLRIPLVVLTDVFKYMDFREKFLISLMSKRARNTLKLTCGKPHFLFLLSNDFTVYSDISDRASELTPEGHYYVRGQLLKLRFHSDGVNLNSQSIRKQLFLAEYLLDTFTNSTSSIYFNPPTQPSAVLKFMKMINQRQGSINLIDYQLKGDSSEFIPKILDECTEVTGYISIDGVFPDDFVYTPPRPFKAKQLSVGSINNWFNLENFMSCSRICLFLGKNSNRTAETYNSFFQNWINSDVPLQELTLGSFEEPEKQLIMDALNNQGTMKKTDEEWFELERETGSEFFIHIPVFDFDLPFTPNQITIYTKQAYLEQLREEEEEENALAREFGNLGV
uniref:F-box domain-containing protein n=1 Tax=Caenorhabditis tropicalis TaxID=1561998 RepID=A0A1I7UTN4_9PELO